MSALYGKFPGPRILSQSLLQSVKKCWIYTGTNVPVSHRINTIADATIWAKIYKLNVTHCRLKTLKSAVTLSWNLSVLVTAVQFRVDNRFIVVLIGRRCDSAIICVCRPHIGVDKIVVLLSSNYVAVDVNISVSVLIFAISLMPMFFITASHTYMVHAEYNFPHPGLQCCRHGGACRFNDPWVYTQW